MSATTTTQAQAKGLRHRLINAVRGFATELYVAQGGWIAAPAKSVTAGGNRKQAA